MIPHIVEIAKIGGRMKVEKGRDDQAKDPIGETLSHCAV
jgi:hypothetical protein